MLLLVFFFFNDTATTEIYTLSLHDALPICKLTSDGLTAHLGFSSAMTTGEVSGGYTLGLADPYALSGKVSIKNIDLDPFLLTDRKSTRLNSSHGYISYAVFCLKKKTTPPMIKWPSGKLSNAGWCCARARNCWLTSTAARTRPWPT